MSTPQEVDVISMLDMGSFMMIYGGSDRLRRKRQARLAKKLKVRDFDHVDLTGTARLVLFQPHRDLGLHKQLLLVSANIS